MLNHYCAALTLTSVTHLVLAVFVYLKGQKKLTNITYSLYSFAIAWWSILEVLAITASNPTHALFLWRLNHVGVIFIPIFFVNFVMSLLEPQELLRSKKIVAGSYATGLLFLILNATPLFISKVIPKFSFKFFINPGVLYAWFFFLWVGWAVYGLLLLFRIYVSASGFRRNQLKYFYWSMLIAYLGGAPNFLPTFNIEIPILMPFGTYAIPIYALVTTYAIVRYRLMDINLAITRTAVFAVVYALILGLPLLIASWWQPTLEKLLGQRWWIGLWILGAGLATAAHYVNLDFQRRAEDRLMAEQRRYQAALRQASQGMTLIKELDRLLNLIVHLLTQKVRIKHAAIYLWDERAKRFILQAARQWLVDAAPTFGEKDSLPQYLQEHRAALVTEELSLQAQGGQKQIGPVIEALRTLDAAVLVPSFVEDHCLGFLALGEKNSGALYTPDDLQVFQVLANQAALAIENAQFYEELKRTQADLFQTAKMASLGHMAGGMSHQINNRFHVLTILAGTLKATMKELDPASLEVERLKDLWVKTLEILNKIEENALRGGDIVKTLLRFSRPSREYQPVAVKQIITTALEVVQFRVNLAALDIQQDIPEDIPPVMGNLNQLSDSVFNLITNAYDAIQKKGELIQSGQLSPSPKDPIPFRGRFIMRARLEKGPQKSWVNLEIQDNGTGITKTELENLFIPFFTTKATAEKGTGLGLYIIQRILEQHGGSIAAGSDYGVGTTFTMRLPALDEPPKP